MQWVETWDAAKYPTTNRTKNYLAPKAYNAEKHLKKKFFFAFFLRLNLQHMEVPRLGIESELHLLAYTTATATPAPSHLFDLYHSS